MVSPELLTNGSQDVSVLISGGYDTDFIDMFIDAGNPDGLDDTFVVQRNGNNLEIVVNGGNPQIVAVDSFDTIVLQGSTDQDTMIVHSLGTGARGNIVLAGGTGRDIAEVYDSSGDDRYTANPLFATLDVDDGYTVSPENIWKIQAFATAGVRD